MTKTIVFQLQITAPEISRTVTLKAGITSLGREPGNDIQLPFPKVSRRHARFECTDSMCIIIDQESANGTLVDGIRLTPNVPTPLNDNSVIEIDPVKIICKHVVAEKEEKPPVQQTISRKDATAPKPAAEAEEKPAAEEKPEPEEKSEPDKKEKKPEKKTPEPKAAPPEKPPEEPPQPPSLTEPEPKGEPLIPPGLSNRSIRYLDYLPGIYHTDFMERFMAVFESILMPVEWNIDNFDVFLSPGTSPFAFLPWLSNWYDIIFDSSWPEEKRRQLLKEAHLIYARRGTRWSLSRLLEIYTGQEPQIKEFEEGAEPHTFSVILKEDKDIDKNLVTRLIDQNKPAHTFYKLEFKK